nr:glutaminyl-peptide cyclotransferase [Corynebacterium liangguodongii]
MSRAGFPALLAAAFLPLCVVSCGAPTAQDAADPVERLVAAEVARYPFNPDSFTQGLEVGPDGNVVVGTGQYGLSRIYRSTPDGEELASAVLDPRFFGEGLTRVGDSIWQLTWKEGVAIKRDAASLEETGRASYSGQGWGLCSRGDEVIFSDGTAELRRMDPVTFSERGRLTVTLEGQPVDHLNELECVGDEIYANVFLSTDILRIDASTGAVTAVIDASGLPNNAAPDPNNVLNGIAHIPGTDEFYLAGKRWPDLYRVRFVAAPAAH